MRIGFVVNDVQTEKAAVHHDTPRHGGDAHGSRSVADGRR